MSEWARLAGRARAAGRLALLAAGLALACAGPAPAQDAAAPTLRLSPFLKPAQPPAPPAPLYVSPIPRPAAPLFRPWPYDHFFGPPGQAVTRQEVKALGLTQVRFANGVRLNVKPTAFVKDQILLSIRVGRGRLGQPPGRRLPAWQAGGLVLGGTREMTYDDLRQALGGAPLDTLFTVADSAFVLTDTARPTTLARQLQLMTALITRPGFRPDGVEFLRRRMAGEAAGLNRQIIAVEVPALMHGGDDRWRPLPTADDVTGMPASALEAMVGPDLKDGPLELTVVGDVTVEGVIAEVAATLGATAARREPSRPDPGAAAIRPPAGGGPPVILAHGGRADQGLVYAAWAAPDANAQPHLSHVLGLAAVVLQNRLADRLHAIDAIGPAPQVSAVQSKDIDGFGYVEAGADIPAWKADAFYDALWRAVDDLARTPPDREELRRTLTPLLAAYDARGRTNAFWLGALTGAQADPRFAAGLADAETDERAVTGEEISTAVRTWLPKDRAWRLILRAAAPPKPPTTLATAGPPVPLRDDVWPQTYSDLTADPDIRFGLLPNGMRYAIRRNASPKGETSLRLRIGAGALEERDDQAGLAHFLEHMAFKGSTHVKADDMLKILQRLGLESGPDANAFTEKRQTTFKFDLPQSDPERLDTGLMLLRDIASELKLSQAAMDAERGVILSEERLNESPAREAGKLETAFYLEGQLAGRRDPIGRVEVLTTAPVSRIRDLYQAYYRPGNATLIAVGDFDAAAMEAAIKAHFADWSAAGAPGPFPDLGRPKPRGETVDLLVREGLPLAEAVVWVRPFDNEGDSFARERRRLIEDLGLDIMSKRLSSLAAGANAPFVSGSATRVEVDRSATMVELGSLPAVGGLEASLTALIDTQRRMARFGVSEDEFEDALRFRRDNLSAAIGAAPTADSATLADRYLADVNDGRVTMGPVESLAQFDALTAGLTRADVAAALGTAFTGQGPLIVVTSPTPLDGGEAGVRALYDAIAARAVTDEAAVAKKAWPYGDFGPPGKVVWRRDVADLGVTQARFANGVRLNVKPTPFGKNRILVVARLGEGLIGMAPDTPAPSWLVSALGSAGTREMTVDEIQKTLQGTGVTFSAGYLDNALVLSGQTGPHDFGRQMELLTAYIARPGYRPEAVERTRKLMAVAAETINYTPANVLAVNLPPLLHGGDRRWAQTPTDAELAAVTPRDLSTLVDKTLRSGALELTVVGDVTVDRAIFEAARTFGTLPPRADPPAVPAASPTLAPPAGGGPPVILHHAGRADQAIAYAAWPTTDFYADTHQAHVLVLAAAILENRLIDRVRVNEGASYAPSADAVGTGEILKFGYVQASVEIPPDKIDGFYRDLDAIVADMARAPPSADELLRAKAPLLDGEAKSHETLEYWSYFLADTQADPRGLAAIRRKLPDFASITAEEISAVCRKFLSPAKPWTLVVLPGADRTSPPPR